MNDYEKKYNELKEEYIRSDGAAASVQALYEYKDFLDEQTEKDAKWVLVELCETLGLYGSAYETLRRLTTWTNIKAKKRLKELRGCLRQGDSFALRRPDGGKERERQAALLAELPQFKYHPNPLETEAFRLVEPPVICSCCGKATEICYSGPFYAFEDAAFLCPNCISNGDAAKKLDGAFQDEFSLEGGVNDADKTDELIHRTPGYHGWQQEYWRTHCGDYCAFVGYVGYRDLKQMGIAEEILNADDPVLYAHGAMSKEMVKAMENGGSVQGYLFKCLHCGKHLLWMDRD